MHSVVENDSAVPAIPVLDSVLEGLMLPVQALTTGFVHVPPPVAASAPAVVTSMGATPNESTQTNVLAAPSWVEVPHALARADAPVSTANVLTAQDHASQTSVSEKAANLATVGAGQAGAVEEAASVGADTHSRQGVRIGSVGLMLTYEDSSELTDIPHLYYLPNAPAWIMGLANLHGNFVPVLDLAAYLGIEKDKAPSAPQGMDTDKSMLLVLGHGAEAAGIIIDGIPQRLVPLQQQQTDMDTAPALLMPHIREAYFLNGQLWFDLDCRSLLSALEQAVINYAQV